MWVPRRGSPYLPYSRVVGSGIGPINAIGAVSCDRSERFAFKLVMVWRPRLAGPPVTVLPVVAWASLSVTRPTGRTRLVVLTGRLTRTRVLTRIGHWHWPGHPRIHYGASADPSKVWERWRGGAVAIVVGCCVHPQVSDGLLEE